MPEAEALVAQAARAGRVLMVGFNRRYAPVYVAAREAFAERRPEACLALKNRPGTEYRATLENAIHMVDLLRWFCGEAVDVHGRAAFTDPYRETTAAATLRFDSGALAVLLANRSTSHWVERLEVFGHGRSAVVEAPDRVSLGQDGQARVTEMTPIHMGWAHVADKLGFRQELEHFVECVRTRAEPRTSGADAVRTQALMDRLLQAMGLPLEDQPARLSRRRAPAATVRAMDRGPGWPTRAALAAPGRVPAVALAAPAGGLPVLADVLRVRPARAPPARAHPGQRARALAALSVPSLRARGARSAALSAGRLAAAACACHTQAAPGIQRGGRAREARKGGRDGAAHRVRRRGPGVSVHRGGGDRRGAAAAVKAHAAEDHGVKEITPELAAEVKAAIRTR